MTTAPQKFLRFPIDQGESAVQQRADTLLAEDVYSQLHSFVQEALPSADDEKSEPGTQRQHRAILIDGARGTGKSAVLVNLGLYLNDVDKELFNRVHIFKPIDPTLLEDHDNLFLNVIVAAVLSDKTVIDAQNIHPEKRAQLHKQLQRLGSALEGLQKQRAQQGLDKLRSFIGNNQLIAEVDRFLREVCALLGKKLLILTIDDVDTSLDQAFENLEVVRRYLVSPVVLPIISGDQHLYSEVTWREFHGKLLRDSNYYRKEAYAQAKELAKEYHRKILPLQYRLKMPAVADYLRNYSIVLTHDKHTAMKLPLPLFHTWVESFLNGAVNGVENSYLRVPLNTVRSLAQLIYRVKDLLPDLARYIAEKQLDDIGVKRALMLSASGDQAPKTDPSSANTSLRETLVKVFAEHEAKQHGPHPEEQLVTSRNEWRRKLLDQFKFDPEAGAAFLVLQAQMDWFGSSVARHTRDVFDTPLFQPLLQRQDTFAEFETQVDLSDWQRALQVRAPEGWLARLPQHAILPYPVPEVGRAITSAKSKKKYRFSDGEHQQINNFLVDLMLHKNFYSSNKKAVLICVGRFFELLITSLLRDINENDVQALLQRPPFYSFSAVATTKTLFLVDDDGKQEDEWPEDTDAELAEREETISWLVSHIREWREQYKVSNIQVSPWLIYNVFNKVMNQTRFFNQPMAPNVIDKEQDERTVARTARKAFYSIWSAFGSFEKGNFYGLEPVISTVNIGDGEKFENSDLYRQNIAPFYSEKDNDTRAFGEQTRSTTFLLGEHPLRKWVEQTPRPAINLSKLIPNTDLGGLTYPASTAASEVERAKAELGKALGVELKSRVETTTLVKALRKKKMRPEEANALHVRLRREFPKARRLMATFLRAIDALDENVPSTNKSAG